MRWICCLLGCLGTLAAGEVQAVVYEKDTYNFWTSPGFLWALLSMVIVGVLIVIAYRYEIRYLEESRPKKNIKLEE